MHLGEEAVALAVGLRRYGVIVVGALPTTLAINALVRHEVRVHGGAAWVLAVRHLSPDRVAGKIAA